MNGDITTGLVLEISTSSYKGRRFTVVESNGHRAVLRGARGARRVLVYSKDGYSIHEDDGQRNRGRPCTVGFPTKATSSPSEKLRESHWPPGWYWSSEDKSMAIGPRGLDVDRVWVHEKRYRGKPPHIETPFGGSGSVPVSVIESVIFQFRRREEEECQAVPFGETSAPTPRKHYPITAMDLAQLMRCESARDVAEWAIERDVTHASVTGDRHAADNAAAMKLYLSSLEIRRISEGAAG